MECRLQLNKKDILNLIGAVYKCDTSKATISYYPGNQMESEELTISFDYPVVLVTDEEEANGIHET